MIEELMKPLNLNKYIKESRVFKLGLALLVLNVLASVIVSNHQKLLIDLLSNLSFMGMSVVVLGIVSSFCVMVNILGLGNLTNLSKKEEGFKRNNHIIFFITSTSFIYSLFGYWIPYTPEIFGKLAEQIISTI